jgi:hemin uptake protein HemP
MNVARNLEEKFDSQQLALSKDAATFCEVNRDVFFLNINLVVFHPKLKVITSHQGLMFRTNPVFYSEKSGEERRVRQDHT